MQHHYSFFFAGLALFCAAGCGSDDATDVRAPSTKTVLALEDVKTNTSNYDWFDFRPNVMKLILAGAAETEHVAILWYTVTDGSVGLHFHAKTESVYVIDGTQTDAKGIYPTGTVYFNPPGSGHQIMNSSGFFILAYASPPDFAGTDLIGEYAPVRIDTTDTALTSTHPFVDVARGLRTFDVPLDGSGGLTGQLIELAPGSDAHEYLGNYLLVLRGSCVIDAAAHGPETLVVTKGIPREPFAVAAGEGSSCLVLGVSF
jgi:hypothetical protein